MAVIPSGVRHRIIDDQKNSLSVYVICLASSEFPSREVLAKAFRMPRLLHDPVLAGEVVSMLRRILYEQRTRADESFTLESALLAQLLVRIIRHQSGSPRPHPAAASRVRSYVEEIDQSFWLRESMDGVARRLGMSRRHFSACFRKQAGSSWLEFLHARRMEHAAKLLKTTTLPIKVVSFECGYDDLSHFYRRFSAHFGDPPDAWRAKNNGEH